MRISYVSASNELGICVMHDILPLVDELHYLGNSEEWFFIALTIYASNNFYAFLNGKIIIQTQWSLSDSEWDLSNDHIAIGRRKEFEYLFIFRFQLCCCEKSAVL